MRGWWLVLAACAPPPVSGEAGTAVLMQSVDPSDPNSFFDMPWPLETRRHPDGRIDLTGHPRPTDHLASAMLFDVVSESTGFSQVSPAWFRFDELPPDWSVEDGPLSLEQAFFVDLDDGRRLPVMAQRLEPDDYTPAQVLAIAPVWGDVLTAGHRWAAVLMREAGREEPLGVPQALAEIREGVGPTPLVELFADLWARVDAAGLDPTRVAAATVFRPGDEVAANARFTDAVREAHSPRLTNLRLTEDDNPRLCRLTATLTVPQFQSGEPPFDGGEGRFYTDGEAPEVLRVDDAPVVLALPRQTMPEEGWPLVFFAHGTDGAAADVVDRGPRLEVDGPRQAGRGPAWVLAERGIASVGMATLLAPERLGFERDRAYLNLSNVGAYRDTWRQAMSDVRLLFDALNDLRLSEEVEGCEGLVSLTGEHRFQPEILGMGQSAGAHLITEVAAIDDRVRAVAPTGSGGLWSLLLSEGSAVGGPPELIAFALGTDVRLTPLHPGLAMLQHAFEAGEPLVHAQRLLTRPLPGHAPRHVYLPASAGDSFFPEVVYDAMAVAYGTELEGPEYWDSMGQRLDLAGRPARLEAPVSGNVDRITAVVSQWRGDGIDDAHGVFGQDGRIQHQYACFFRTFLDHGVPTVVDGVGADEPCEPR